MKAVELYAGAGGLAMGVGLAGFKPLAVVEWDRWACDTIRENQRRGFPLVADWPLYEGDVRKFDWSSIEDDVDLLAGGPPCQPFSMGGKHQAHDDTRDMFPATVDIVRKLRPKAFIVENVKGLTRSTFANYYQYILLQLEFPEVPAKRNEEWFDHLLRLQVERTSGRQKGRKLTYNVVPTLVNAADYGVPQKRERVFIVGFRSDLAVDWSFPRPTHSFDQLLRDQWVSGEYWERHGVARRNRPTMAASMEARVRRLASSLPFAEELPWRTVRDAIAGLPSPSSRAANHYSDHRLQPGARVYPGHTGSPLDLPAKTLKAGDHGVPGGENMLVNTDGSVRYFSIRESARIQTFPDGFIFHGSWTETMRQLGNAVPVALGHAVARSVAEKLATVQLEKLSRQRGSVRGAA
ncbi:DNA cytosine methyltransferase [Paraburkholderia gardini]|uniref:DNA cytosine methyltransferase n=1 Tax=Paraburkholderia gardini TaxID=2823469 RepID=UPI001DCE8C91|nr:DNA cytosine methyltransferase [Paraburkholderia gardini]CAG4911402.1 Modification methylase HhaI [Paraburkholderia gardini]